jgi:hypothetical protein
MNSSYFEINVRTSDGSCNVTTVGDVRQLTLPGGTTIWMGGTVDGVRSRSGGWLPTPASLSDLIDPNNLESSVRRLEGRFVIVVQNQNQLWIGADSQGRSDVYYSKDCSAVSTRLSALDGTTTGVYDQLGWLHTFVAYGSRPAKKQTLYCGVRRLGVGQMITGTVGSLRVVDGSFEPLSSVPLNSRSLNEYADRLLESIRLRASAEGNVVYLSSGWDSTSILACLVHLFGPAKVRAVIGRMKYSDRRGVINQFEIDRARLVAEYFGVVLDVIDFDYTFGASKLLDECRDFFKAHQFYNLTAFNHYLLARHVAKTTNGGETVFAGEISDGAHNLGFSQFVSIFHPTQEFREYADKMHGYLFGPTFFENFKSGTFKDDEVYRFLRGRLGEVQFDELAETEGERIRQFFASFFLRSGRFPLASLSNERVLTKEGADYYSKLMEESYLGDVSRRATATTLYSWFLRTYNSFHWQSSTVAPLAATAEHFGLQAALPFWDSRLQESLAAFPEQAGRGLDLNPTKFPLKWTLKNRVDYPLHLQVGPHSYLYDVDPSFSHSAELMYGSSFKDVFVRTIETLPHRQALDSKLFDFSYIERLATGYSGGHEVRGRELTDLLNLAMTGGIGWYG